jgi:hypothetical protein
MARGHSSFLLRCWWLNGSSERVEVEHIQTGEKVLVMSVAEAVAWICTRHDDRTVPDRNERARMDKEASESEER